MSDVLHMNKTCRVCGVNHFPKPQCSHENIVKRMNQLLEANKTIPSLLEANKIAVETAQHFQKLIAQTDRALDLLQEVLQEYSNGPLIWADFTARLDAWAAKGTLNQDTGQLPLNLPENSISNEINAKNSTGETTPGNSLPVGSSK